MEELLRGLNERFDGGVSKTLAEELALSRKVRDEEAERFAAVSLLLSETMSLAEEEEEERSSLLRALSAAEAAQHLEETGLVVGVTPNDVLLASEEERVMVTTQLERRVQEKGSRLALVAGMNSLEQLLADAARVNAGAAALAAERASVEQLRIAVAADEQQLVTTLASVANAAKERGDSAALQAEWLAAQAEGMACKMLLLEKRMMKVTNKRGGGGKQILIFETSGNVREPRCDGCSFQAASRGRGSNGSGRSSKTRIGVEKEAV